MEIKSNTYCIQPFREIAMKNFSGEKLSVFWPCCIMANQITKDRDINVLNVQEPWKLTPQEMYDHPRMQELRHNLLNGIKDDACKVCWHQEERDLKSFRQFNNESIFYEKENGLSSIDITASNICNLRCRMCTPTCSHQLMIDHNYFEKNNLLSAVKSVTRRWGIVDEAYRAVESKQWQWMMDNTDKIKLLKASGGEPFYDNKIIQLLERYIETGAAKNTILNFHTNATLFDKELVEILNQFKLNNHTFSIDGIGKTYEYIRYPATFKQLEDSVLLYLNAVKNYHKIVQFTIVVSAHNLLDMEEYIKWTRSLPAEIAIQFSEIYDVDRGIAIKRLPVHLLKHIKQKIQKYSLRNNLEDMTISNLLKSIDGAIDSNEENKHLIKLESELFDKPREQSYKDFLNADLVEWLDS